MKKTIHINLGEHPFTIDDDAYLLVERYINELNAIFASTEGGEEIVRDIEIRFAEILSDKMGKRLVVNSDDINYCIGQIGDTATFTEEGIPESETGGARQAYNKKRLYRDADDKVVAGVCSGIAHYFGIEEPVWVRIAFALMFFLGFSPLVYIVMWILVPSLSLRGKPLGDETIGTVVSSVKEEVVEVKDNFRKLFSKVTKKGYQL